MKIVRHRAFCRAGLIGNPTDGYNGKTISFTMANFSALVVMYAWEHLEILWSKQDKNRFETIDELVEDVNLNGYYGGIRLVKATIKKFVEFCRRQSIRLEGEPFSVRYETDIPRGVGLSGSSAIVVATLKCLMEYYGVTIPLPVQASLARSVENDELGIACGFQDRVVQVYGGLVYMDFSCMRDMNGFECGVYEKLDTGLLPPLYIAYDLAASKESGAVHGSLRRRLADDTQLKRIMGEIAALVPMARQALERHDHSALHDLINRNFDLRCQLYEIRADHRDMVETARRAGASAKFAGSGGAIVGSYSDEEVFARLQYEMATRNPAWRVLKPRLD